MAVLRSAIGSVLDDLPFAGGEAVPRPTFGEVYEEHFAFVWRTVRRLGTLEADVDDVVQEIFVIAHRKLPEFEGRSSVKTWLFGIVHNVVRTQRRMLLARHPASVRAEVRADPDVLTDPTGRSEDWASKGEAARLVGRLLGTLDDEKREVFVLAELEQMTAPEIAAALGIALNTVYSRLRLARQEFAEAAARLRAGEERRTK